MAEQFGPFSLLRLLGSGGMAEVYLARIDEPPGEGRLCALKRIRAQFSGDAEFIAMLAEEAGISARLDHPNIVHTYELGQVQGQYYISMEYVEGIDLYRLMQRLEDENLSVPFPMAAYVTREVCRGLGYAHALKSADGQPLGLIHRDVSPMNVLLSRQGDVKLCDFGIAKATSRVGMTKSGVIKGKFHYLSPEYASGGRIDRRTDVFSTGICLWEMLCGRMLYDVQDGQALLDVVRAAEVPPPSRFRPEVPPRLEQIVLRALDRRLAARYPGCDELGLELDSYLEECHPNFARDHLAEFLHNTVPDESEGRGQSGSTERSMQPRHAGEQRSSCRRKPDQLTARIELTAASSSDLSPGMNGPGPPLAGQSVDWPGSAPGGQAEESSMADQPKGPSELGGKTVAMSADEVFKQIGGGAEAEQPAAPPAPASAPKRSIDLRKPAPARPAAPRPAAKPAPEGGNVYEQKTSFFNAADPKIAAALEAAKARTATGPGKPAPAAPRAATPRPAQPAAAPAAARPARPVAQPRTPTPAPAPAPAPAAPAAAEDAYSQKTAFFDASDPRIAAALDKARSASATPSAPAPAPQRSSPGSVPQIRKVEATPVAAPPAAASPPTGQAPVRPSGARPMIRKVEDPAAAPAPQPKVVKAGTGIKVLRVQEESTTPAPPPKAEPAEAAGEGSARERIAKARARKAELAAEEEAGAPARKEPEADAEAPERPSRRKAQDREAGERPTRSRKTEARGDDAAEKAEKPEKAEREKPDKKDKEAESQPRIARGHRSQEKKKLLSLPVILSLVGVIAFGVLSFNFVMSMFSVRMGSIEINTVPQGATVTLDGKEQPKKTPCTIKDVPANQEPHTILVALEGYQEASEEVILYPEDPQDKITITLKPLPGSLKITSEPDGATVMFHGEVKGKTPYLAKDLDRIRSIPITIQKEGYEDYDGVWEWKGKERDAKLSVTLERRRRGRGR